MKAILCTQYCGPDDLVLTEVPDPVAGPGEAVIAIKSAALNFFDLLMIQGKYQIKPPAADDQLAAKRDEAACHRRAEPGAAAGDQYPLSRQEAFFKHGSIPYTFLRHSGPVRGTGSGI